MRTVRSINAEEYSKHGLTDELLSMLRKMMRSEDSRSASSVSEHNHNDEVGKEGDQDKSLLLSPNLVLCLRLLIPFL